MLRHCVCGCARRVAGDCVCVGVCACASATHWWAMQLEALRSTHCVADYSRKTCLINILTAAHHSRRYAILIARLPCDILAAILQTLDPHAHCILPHARRHLTVTERVRLVVDLFVISLLLNMGDLRHSLLCSRIHSSTLGKKPSDQNAQSLEMRVKNDDARMYTTLTDLHARVYVGTATKQQHTRALFIHRTSPSARLALTSRCTLRTRRLPVLLVAEGCDCASRARAGRSQRRHATVVGSRRTASTREPPWRQWPIGTNR